MKKETKPGIIAQTENWIVNVVIGCNFCPFAAKEVSRKSIHYEVLYDATMALSLLAVSAIFKQLDEDKKTETAFLILPDAFTEFSEYLLLTDKAEALLIKEHYSGVFQLASFHPSYLFAGSSEADASNYTNRSPYPMLHFLREASVTKAVDSHPNIDSITEQNIAFANRKGLVYMQNLLKR